ncbi:MAG: hypothetical protein WAT78_05870 [Rhizobiaceae bacterium]
MKTILALSALVFLAIGPAKAADCHAVGEQVAAENGGRLAKATAEQRDGQPVCVVVVLKPAENGGRPKRTEIIVPQ